MKYTDKTDEEWDEIVEKWHTDTSITKTLPEYMGLDDEQYLRFVHNIRNDTLNNEDVKSISADIVKEVVTELVIKPKVETISKIVGRNLR